MNLNNKTDFFLFLYSFLSFIYAFFTLFISFFFASKGVPLISYGTQEGGIWVDINLSLFNGSLDGTYSGMEVIVPLLQNSKYLKLNE
jgi:hypothetical protein